MLELVAAFICLTSLLTYVNFRFIGLPPTIGVMVTALMFSLLLQGLSFIGYPGLEERVQELIGQIDFGDLLMNWMLSFLLFAGALHVNFNDVRSYRWPIGLLATVGVLIATTVIGSLAYWIFGLFGWHISFLYCLLFGALISPTDPIAVLGVLRTANASKPLKTRLSASRCSMTVQPLWCSPYCWALCNWAKPRAWAPLQCSLPTKPLAAWCSVV